MIFEINPDLENQIQTELQEQYDEQQKEFRNQILAKAQVAAQQRKNLCSCVLFAKAITGYNQPVGWARNWPVNTTIPEIGDVVVTNESFRGHVIIITWVREGQIDVVEANYETCKMTLRTLNLSDKSIIGYWSGSL